LDYQRRDFTINAIYYTSQRLKTPIYENEKEITEEDILKILKKE
jgi:tRNA nucleotidyltransferase/poly(A) polymerase